MSAAPPLNESAPAATSTVVVPPELRTCNGCRQEYPLETFRFKNRAAGTRHRVCRDCLNRYAREVRAPRRRRNDLSKSVTALASTENRDDVQLLAAVVRQMMRRFGGLDRMCETWARNVEALAARRSGNRLLLKTFQAISHMAMAVEAVEQTERQQKRFEISKLDSGELVQLIIGLLSQTQRAEHEEPPAGSSSMLCDV